nr:Transposon Ty3-I Gag-Pol polyprotein [Ipomoea batatas]
MIEGCVNEARMAQWEEMGELFIEEEDIEEPCTEEAEIEELYATNDPIGEEPPLKVELKPLPPNLRGETLFILTKLGKDYVPWFADIVNYLVSGYIPKDFSYNKRKRFLHDVRDYFWDEPLLFKRCVDGIVRRCRETDVPNMLQFWTELSGSNTRYDASSSKSSLFSKPLKLIQHTLSRSICSHQYSTGVAQTLDMLCLYGMENKTEIDRDILLSLFKDMRAILGPVGNTRKRARRGAAAQAQDRAEEEEENEEGHEEETQAMPEVGGGSSSSTFEQVLAQLAAMQLQVGQVHSQVGLLNSRMDNLETAVGHLETRNEAHAYQTWLRGQFPPGPQYYYDPAGGPPHYYDPTGGPPHFYSSAGGSQPYYGAAGGSQYYFDPAEGSQPQYDPSRGPQFPYDPTDF